MVIAHGLPYPENIEIAQSMEEAIARRELCQLLSDCMMSDRYRTHAWRDCPHGQRAKRMQGQSASSRYESSQRSMGRENCSGNHVVRAPSSIRFFATGGVGGVHRGATTSLDISADFQELSRRGPCNFEARNQS